MLLQCPLLGLRRADTLSPAKHARRPLAHVTFAFRHHAAEGVPALSSIPCRYSTEASRRSDHGQKESCVTLYLQIPLHCTTILEQVVDGLRDVA